MFYTLDKSLNEDRLLEKIWADYPSYEAFFNVAPEKFDKVLSCLCEFIINGDIPLNWENVRKRFPIFIQLTKNYYKNKNYYYSTQALRQAKRIADYLNYTKMKEIVKKTFDELKKLKKK